jgi:hypothetical protein
MVAPSGIAEVSKERIDLYWRSEASSPVRSALAVASEELVEPPVLEPSLDSSTRPSSAAIEVSVIVVAPLEPELEEDELLEDDDELEEDELELDEEDDELDELLLELDDELDEPPELLPYS